ncbi:hypothetical protein QR680_000847 [Steinernema hermaphroditum]|uniref:Uncharacterized protein n=1 Tax=Steinernema hermaphroditum TaxID=289476 RepID=A0AA39GW31_9BILA|nr:hypothetical protein QR680_000847 [Steinernema hermaphroditum]
MSGPPNVVRMVIFTAPSRASVQNDNYEHIRCPFPDSSAEKGDGEEGEDGRPERLFDEVLMSSKMDRVSGATPLANAALPNDFRLCCRLFISIQPRIVLMMHVAFAVLLVASLMIASVHSGAVGKCRTECVELNKYKIVRVHLEEKLVHAGVCRNVSNVDKPMAHVFPFVCDRDVGKWTTDEHDEEGIVEFPRFCPETKMVEAEMIDSCP